MTIFYCLRFESLPTWRTRSSYLYLPWTGWPGYTPRHWVFDSRLTNSKVKITLRLRASQSVSQSWCRAPSGAHDQIFITVWQLWSCYCGAPSLTRGQLSVPFINPWQGPRRNHRFQHCLYCCVWIRCRRNMFVSRSLLSNGSTRYFAPSYRRTAEERHKLYTYICCPCHNSQHYNLMEDYVKNVLISSVFSVIRHIATYIVKFLWLDAGCILNIKFTECFLLVTTNRYRTLLFCTLFK
jgi:hypothetical protein